MNWIKNRILSFVQKAKDTFKKSRPSKEDQEKSLWINCPECNQMQLKEDLKNNYNICKCSYHFDLDPETKYKTSDFGSSLAKYNIPSGPYLVLPILGPSTARDSITSTLNLMGGDPWYNVTIKNDTTYFNDADYYTSKATSGVDFRAKNFNSIENLEKNSLDFYASVKSLYLQDRQQKILNTKKIVETQVDSDWEEIENQ